MARPESEPESDRGVDNAQTLRLDREREFKARHGACTKCGGTGFETVMVKTRTLEYEAARRCSDLSPVAAAVGSRETGRQGGFGAAGDVRLPYRDR